MSNNNATRRNNMPNSNAMRRNNMPNNAMRRNNMFNVSINNKNKRVNNNNANKIAALEKKLNKLTKILFNPLPIMSNLFPNQALLLRCH